MDELLRAFDLYSNRIDQQFIKLLLQSTLSDIKSHPQRFNLASASREKISEIIFAEVKNRIERLLASSFKRIINATGVILHTGLGRAPLSPALLPRAENIFGYTNLEINLSDGKRGDRLVHVTPLLNLLTESEDAVVVNNNAAAVLLILNSLAKRKEVIVSRGELVEIGGSFRMPEVMKSSNAKMVEVGSTNKTHLQDYEAAISEKTAAIMLVHPSNYKIVGFAEKPDYQDVVQMAHNHRIPVIYDVGSGAFVDMQKFGFEYEPVIRDVVKAGVDIISFSGDKLLGGPQAGIIVGKSEYMKRIRKNHLLRALRCDKIILGLLAEVLKQYLHPASLQTTNPTLSVFSRNLKQIDVLIDDLLSRLSTVHRSKCQTVDAEGRAGSGAYPVHPIPSRAIQIVHPTLTASKLSNLLRKQDTPVFGYIADDIFHLNLLTVMENDIQQLAEILNKIL